MGKQLLLKKWTKLMWMGFLALSVVSCSRPLSDLQNGNGDIGFTYCDGTLGSFDIYVARTPEDYTLFELYVIPVQVADSGPASINIANQTPAYRTLVSQITFNPGDDVFVGYITENDLLTYDILALTQYDGTGADFLNSTSELDAICTLPLPGEGTEDTQTQLVKKAGRRGMSVSKARRAFHRSK